MSLEIYRCRGRAQKRHACSTRGYKARGGIHARYVGTDSV